MLRLKPIRRLNCSAGGVLYHYTTSWGNLRAIVGRGLRPSNDEYLDEKRVPFISFSRTRVNPPYYGDKWKYGIIFDKNKLSGLGKFVPFRHVWYGRVGQLKMTFGDPELSRTPQDGVYKVRIFLDMDYTIKCMAKVFVSSTMLDDLWDAFDKLPYDEAKDLAIWLIDNAPKLGLKLEHKAPSFDADEKEYIINEVGKDPKDLSLYGKYNVTGSIRLDELVKVAPAALQDLLNNIIGQTSTWIFKEDPTETAEVTTYLGMDTFRIYTTKEEVVELYNYYRQKERENPDSDISVFVSPTENYWELCGEFEDFKEVFHKMPELYQKINVKMRGNVDESEDRLWLTHQKAVSPPGEREPPIEETKAAIIGIIVPRLEYYSDDADDFRRSHPNIPIYAYATKNEPRMPEDSEPIPKEAYRNPVA